MDLAVFFPIWLFLYFFRKVLRRELLTVSMLFAVVAPISEIIYLRNYWRPQTLFSGIYLFHYPVPVLEDFLFGFFIGGIASVIYEEMWGKRISNRRNRTHHWVWFIPSLFGLSFLVLVLSIGVFNFNAVYANILVFAVCSLVMLAYRQDLWLDSLMSGILVGCIMLLAYAIFLKAYPGIIQKWWLMNNLSGFTLMGVPVEEFLWAFGMGMMAGPLYEFMAGLKFKKSFYNK